MRIYGEKHGVYGFVGFMGHSPTSRLQSTYRPATVNIQSDPNTIAGETMSVSVSMINMKGGVGKTTIATQLAWYATRYLNKKVLLIDLDPQANASQSVMSPQRYVQYLNKGGLTVVDIFEEFTPTGPASGCCQGRYANRQHQGNSWRCKKRICGICERIF